MQNFRVALKEVSEPYRICTPVGQEPIYDFGVTGVLENLVYEYMDKGEISASFNYCDFACDGETIQGCMTITIFKEVFVPEVFTFLYERELNTCG